MFGHLPLARTSLFPPRWTESPLPNRTKCCAETDVIQQLQATKKKEENLCESCSLHMWRLIFIIVFARRSPFRLKAALNFNLPLPVGSYWGQELYWCTFMEVCPDAFYSVLICRCKLPPCTRGRTCSWLLPLCVDCGCG